jgi:hypothetical protein
MMFWLWLCLGGAQADTDEGVYEITVWGEVAIQAARSTLVREMESLGYRALDRGTDEVLFRPPKGWMGKAEFSRDGVLSFRRPFLGVAPAATEIPTLESNHALSRDPTAGAVGAGFWVLPSQRILAPAWERVRQGVEEEVIAYRDVLRATALHEDLERLPGRLDALWERGEPLDGGPVLASAEERRASVLGYWSARADTPAGEALSRAVEAWLLDVVEASEDPITEAERAAAVAARADGRPLP